MAEGFKPVGINAGKYYNSDPTSRISNFHYFGHTFCRSLQNLKNFADPKPKVIQECVGEGHIIHKLLSSGSWAHGLFVDPQS